MYVYEGLGKLTVKTFLEETTREKKIWYCILILETNQGYFLAKETVQVIICMLHGKATGWFYMNVSFKLSE